MLILHEMNLFPSCRHVWPTERVAGITSNILNKETAEASLSRPPLGGTVGRCCAAHKEELHHIEAVRCRGREQRRCIQTLICSPSTFASLLKNILLRVGKSFKVFLYFLFIGQKVKRVPVLHVWRQRGQNSNNELLESVVIHPRFCVVVMMVKEKLILNQEMKSPDSSGRNQSRVSYGMDVAEGNQRI